MKIWIERKAKAGNKGYAEIFIDSGIVSYINETCIGRLYQKHLLDYEIEGICDAVEDALKKFAIRIKKLQKIQQNTKIIEKSEQQPKRLITDSDIVYLGGPMTTKQWYNYMKFFGYEGIIKKLFGCTVINPAKRPIDLPYRLYELQGYSDLSHCTKAIFLDGYRLSTGAMLELSYCQKHNIPIIEESELEEAINRGLGYAEL